MSTINSVSNLASMYSIEYSAIKENSKANMGKTLESKDLTNSNTAVSSKSSNGNNFVLNQNNIINNAVQVVQPDNGYVDVTYSLAKMRENDIKEKTALFMNQVGNQNGIQKPSPMQLQQTGQVINKMVQEELSQQVTPNGSINIGNTVNENATKDLSLRMRMTDFSSIFKQEAFKNLNMNNSAAIDTTGITSPLLGQGSMSSITTVGNEQDVPMTLSQMNIYSERTQMSAHNMYATIQQMQQTNLLNIVNVVK